MSANVQVIPPAGRRKFYVLRWRDPHTGLVRQESTRTINPKKAQRAAARREEKIASLVSDPTDITFSQFKDRYWEEVLPGLAVRTRDARLSAFNHVIKHLNP